MEVLAAIMTGAGLMIIAAFISNYFETSFGKRAKDSSSKARA